MKLSDRALLVSLTISQWGGNKQDKEISTEVTRAKGAKEGSGRYHKSLLPDNPMLKAVKQKATAIRTKFYDNTLPWGLDGTHMLPTSNYLAFMTDFRKEKSEWERLVRDFVAAYPGLLHQAAQDLGASFRASDYPDAASMVDRFKMDIAVMPVPSNDFRVEVATDELERIRAEVEARVNVAAKTAAKDVWERLYKRVEHIAERLSDPEAKFRDSLIENAREMCDLLPRLNFSDDPNLEAMRQEVEAKLVGHNPDVLRVNAKVRSTTAREAKEIMAKMGAFMQGLS